MCLAVYDLAKSTFTCSSESDFLQGVLPNLKKHCPTECLFLSIEVNVDALLVSPVDQSVTYHVLFIEIKLPVLLSRQ